MTDSYITPLVARALVLGVLLLSASVAADQPPTFRSGVQTVVLHATVRSSEGRLVPDLTRDDFEVLDEGRRVEITAFSSDPQPVTVALLLDMSGSMEGLFLRVREATAHLVNSLQPGDRMRIGTFGQEVALSPWLTGDKTILQRVLNEELWPGGPTPLWTATLAAMASLEGEPGRRVVLVLTDGIGSDSNRAGRARTAAEKGGFMVYAVGLDGTRLDPSLVSLANLTGGGHVTVPRDADPAAAFARILEELRHQYVIGFAPVVHDGKLHKVDVRVRRSGFNVRARRTYLAPVQK